jgi:hypothetical protein
LAVKIVCNIKFCKIYYRNLKQIKKQTVDLNSIIIKDLKDLINDELNSAKSSGC